MSYRGSRIAAAATLAAILLHHAAILSAQAGVLRGQVVDETNRPLAGALVNSTCHDGPSVAITGPDGAFQANVSGLTEVCQVTVSRPGFRPVSTTVTVGRFMVNPRVVLEKDAGRAFAVGLGAQSALFATPAESLSSRWGIASVYTTDSESVRVSSGTLERLAGGRRWKERAEARYVTPSGISLAAGANVQRGYGMPFFMGSPFMTADTPDFSPPQYPTATQWIGLVTATTPARRVGNATLSAALQAFTQVGSAGGVSPPKKNDGGVRLMVHIRFK